MTNPLGPLSPAVDTITINGVQAPGQWVLQPGGKVYGWQQQKGYALSGATLNPTGDELIEAPFLVRLWDTAFPLGGTDGGLQYQKFCQFRAQFLKKAVFGIPGGLAAYALGIAHPELNALGGTAWVVKKTPWLTNNGKGAWTGECIFIQYRPPIPAVNKPNAAIPGAAAPVPAASDALQAGIQAKLARNAAARGP